MNKLSFQSIKLTFAIILALANLTFITNPAFSEVQSGGQENSAKPKVPDTGSPESEGNSSNPGGTRPEATCQETNKPPVNLISKDSNFTISAYPTFWFYIPYAPESINKIEFLLLDGKETKTIYMTSVKLTEKSGIIKIKIPSEAQYALKQNEEHRWYLNIYCKHTRNDSEDFDHFLQGSITKIALDNQAENLSESPTWQTYLIYKKNRVWYDAVTYLAEELIANPKNQEIGNAWSNLLKSLNREELLQETFVKIESIPSEN